MKPKTFHNKHLESIAEDFSLKIQPQRTCNPSSCIYFERYRFRCTFKVQETPFSNQNPNKITETKPNFLGELIYTKEEVNKKFPKSNHKHLPILSKPCPYSQKTSFIKKQ